MKYIKIRNSSRTVSTVIAVEDEDFDLAVERLKDFKERWDENPIELANNGSPLYTRDYPLTMHLDALLTNEFKHDFIKEPNRIIEYDDAYEYKGRVDYTVVLKQMRWYHLED